MATFWQQTALEQLKRNGEYDYIDQLHQVVAVLINEFGYKRTDLYRQIDDVLDKEQPVQLMTMDWESPDLP